MVPCVVVIVSPPFAGYPMIRIAAPTLKVPDPMTTGAGMVVLGFTICNNARSLFLSYFSSCNVEKHFGDSWSEIV